MRPGLAACTLAALALTADVNPNRAGCVDIGEAAGNETPQKSSKNIGFDPVAIGGTGACPQDLSFAVLGRSYVISMAPLCDATVSYVKPFVLLAGAIAAALIFIGGLKA